MPRLGSTRSLEDPAEHVRPGVVRGDPQARRLGLPREQRRVRLALDRQAVIEVDPGMAEEGVAHAQALGRLERARLATAEGEGFRAGDMGGERDERAAVVHHLRERRADPIPFEHGEFRRVQGGALAVAENMSQSKDLRLPGGEELLHREFRRGVQPGLARRAVRADEIGAKAVQVGFVAGRGLKGGWVDLDEALGVEPSAHDGGDAGARSAARAARRGGRGSRTAGGREGSRDSEGYGRIAGDPVWPLSPKPV